MEDITILLVLLSTTIFFIILFAIIKFIFIDKRSFTFEIINIPLGFFKFDKRDEYIKNNTCKKVKTESFEEFNINTESNHNDLVNENLSNQAEVFFEVDTDKKVIKESTEDNREVNQSGIIGNSSSEYNEISLQVNVEFNKSTDASSKVSGRIPIVNNKKEIITEIGDEDFFGDDIVYWTASGKVYHKSKKCRTLSRSKVIFDGTIEDSGRYQECIHCK